MLPTQQSKKLNPPQFIRMLKLGAKKIIENEETINKLNIFPVSDHDTGTNIASLMRFLFAEEFVYDNFSQLFTQIADVSLIGASGNSGIIFSSFFSGLAINEELRSNSLSINDFIKCMHLGVDNAYQSVSNPVEGTILSVMKAWVKALDEYQAKADDYLSLLTMAVPKVEEALYQTQQQLAILRENHIVDAGAFAFVLLLQGMHEGLQSKPDIDAIKNHDVDFSTHIKMPDHFHDKQSQFRYCFESTLLTQTDASPITPRLEALGDSLVTTKSPHYLKIHLHTDRPLAATEEILKVGPIRSQKVDDIQLQYEVTNHPKHPIALVIDSSADLPQAFIEEHQIHVVPIQVRIGQSTFLDRLTINLKSLYDAVYNDKARVSTSIPSPESVNRMLHFLADHYNSIICLTISEKVSGFFELLSQQAKKIPKKRISVVNSKTLSAAQGLLAMKAAEWIGSKLSHEEIVTKLEEATKHTTMFAAINNFKTVVQSGRAPQAVGSIANLLHFKPVITVDDNGKPALAAAAIGDRMSEKKLIRLVKQAAAKHSHASIAISHTKAPEKAQKMAGLIYEATGIKSLYILETSCALGVHAGDGCIGIGIISNRE